MPEIPAGFPSRLTDEELAQSLEEWIAEYRRIYTDTRLPELILAFVNTASQEQLRREAAAAARSARNASRSAFFVACAALFVSVLSLVVTLVR